MGRSLTFYAVPPLASIDHTQDSTLVCMSYEYEPEPNSITFDLQECIITKVKEGTSIFGGHKIPEELKPNEDNWRTMKQFTSTLEADEKAWCSKCNLFMHGLFAVPFCLDTLGISHAYSNPVWSSDWNVKGLYLGTSKTELCRRFSGDRLYREIFADDILSAAERLENEGKPIRDSDKEARTESEKVLQWCDMWLRKSEPLHVIVEDEV